MLIFAMAIIRNYRELDTRGVGVKSPLNHLAIAMRERERGTERRREAEGEVKGKGRELALRFRSPSSPDQRTHIGTEEPLARKMMGLHPSGLK